MRRIQMNERPTEELAALIAKHPGCRVTVDNDYWVIHTKRGRELVRGDGRSGWQVLLALAQLAGVTVESV